MKELALHPKITSLLFDTPKSFLATVIHNRILYIFDHQMSTIRRIHLNTNQKSTLNGKEIPYDFFFYMIHASIEVPILKKRTSLAFHIKDDAIIPTEITFEAKPSKSKRLKIPLISNAIYSEYKTLPIHLENIFNRPIVDYTIVNLPNIIVTAIRQIS
jgi:hypothetical protein